MASNRSFWRSPALRNLLILLIIWEIVGQLKLVAGGALPPISAIMVRLWADRADYPGHVGATVWASTLGFLIGNVLAVAAGILFVLFPRVQRLARGVNIAVFALPAIAIAPILVLTLQGMAPRVVLAALGVYLVLSDECEPVSVSPTPPACQAAKRPRHSARAAARVCL